MKEIILNSDQEKAYTQFKKFVTDPTSTFFVLSGYAGTGKSTLVRKLLSELPDLLEVLRALLGEKFVPDILLTATTHKAVENLREITGEDVVTLHSLLCLNIQYINGQPHTHQYKKPDLRDKLIFIDEASYINDELMKYIKDSCNEAKIIFIGDPAQLLSPGCKKSPVFDAGWNEAKLETVMRQAKGNPIMDLSTIFREAVTSRQISGISIDHKHIRHVDNVEFNKLIKEEFARPDREKDDAKIVAFTNQVVIGYNNMVALHVKGTEKLQAGDFVISNHHAAIGKRDKVRNNETVKITKAEPLTLYLTNEREFLEIRPEVVEVQGAEFTLRGGLRVFMPFDRKIQKRYLKRAGSFEVKLNGQYRGDYHYEIPAWVDLRPSYAGTIHKAQGSTYDKVFIDLDDFKKVRDPSMLARLLYVGVSRARHEVILKGDIR